MNRPESEEIEIKRKEKWTEEKKVPWLGAYLDALWLLNEAIREDIARHEKEFGEKLACRRGCTLCCHSKVNVSQIEKPAIALYLESHMPQNLAAAVLKNLEGIKMLEGCPFLVKGSCAVYPVRPICCRLLNVIGQTCVPGEEIPCEVLVVNDSDLHEAAYLKLMEVPRLMGMWPMKAFEEDREVHDLDWTREKEILKKKLKK